MIGSHCNWYGSTLRASWPGARGIVPRRFVALLPIPEPRTGPLCKGRKAGRSNPAFAPVLAPGRRSGCSSAVPYPPPRPVVIIGLPWLGANHPLIRSYLFRSSTFGGTSAARSWLSEATDLSCHLSQVAFAPHEERPAKYRGAWTDGVGKISDMANSTVVLRRDTPQTNRLEVPDFRCPRSALREPPSATKKRLKAHK